MTELPDLDPIPGANVSDDDLLLVYDLENDRAYKVTRGNLLGNVARTNEAADFTTLTADDASFTELTAALLSFTAGGGIADMVTASLSVDIPAVTAGNTDTAVEVMTGATTDMAALVTFAGGLPTGLVADPYVSAADTLTIAFTNASGAGTSAVTKTATVLLFDLPA